jgi:Flp pilus assembly protein TadD
MKQPIISLNLTTLAAHAATAAALCFTGAASIAADDPPAAAAAPARAGAADPFAGARNLIQQERWRDAIAELQRVNQTASADWHNLMGYSYRKARTPDLVAAQRHYDAALTIDPRHRGALEYSGELFLMKNDLPAARQRLASLETVCGRNCAEFEQLRTAIAGFEAKPRN